MFLAANVFRATLLPPPLVPHINTCILGRVGGPINVSTYTGAFVYIFLPIKIPLSWDKLGLEIGINVAIPASYHIPFIICNWDFSNWEDSFITF